MRTIGIVIIALACAGLALYFFAQIGLTMGLLYFIIGLRFDIMWVFVGLGFIALDSKLDNIANRSQ